MPKPQHFKVRTNKSETKQDARHAEHSRHAEQAVPKTSVVSPTLDALRLKQAYTFEIRRGQCAFGAAVDYFPSPSFEAQGHWRRTAAALRAQTIDPISYVRVLLTGPYNFSKVQGHSPNRPPTPAEIIDDENMAEYKTKLARGCNAAKVQKSMDYRYYKGRVAAWTRLGGKSENDAVERALWNADYTGWPSESSPLFCYCYAKSLIQVRPVTASERNRNEVLQEIIDHWFEDACYQYLLNEVGYATEWQSVLSPVITRRAAEVYESRIAKITF